MIIYGDITKLDDIEAITSIDLANSNPSKLIVKEYECLRLLDFSMIKNHEYIFI